MAYLSKDKRNAYARAYKEKNKARIAAQRKALRDSNATGYRDKYNEYYAANKEKIIERTLEYQKSHPEVRKKSQERAKKQSKGVRKGLKDRQQLKPAYIQALIRCEGSNKSIQQKQAEVLTYRLRNRINRIIHEQSNNSQGSSIPATGTH
jgi:hypothetical protein